MVSAWKALASWQEEPLMVFGAGWLLLFGAELFEVQGDSQSSRKDLLEATSGNQSWMWADWEHGACVWASVQVGAAVQAWNGASHRV